MHIMYLVQVAEHVRKKVLDQLDLVCGNLVSNAYYVPCTGGMYLVQVGEHVRKKVLDQLDLVCGNLVSNIYYVPCTGGRACTEEGSTSAGSGV